MTDLLPLATASLLNSVWIGLLVIAVVRAVFYGLGRLGREANATTRATVWMGVMMVLLITHFALVMPAGIGTADPELREASRVEAARDRGRAPAAEPAPSTTAAPELEYAVPPRSTSSITEAAQESAASDLLLPRSLGIILLGLWLAGAVFLLVRLTLGLAALRRLVRSARPLPSDLFDRIRGRAPHTPIFRRPVIAVAQVKSPVAVGFGYRTILLPEELPERLSDDELDPLILHEIAHLERRDDVSLLLQRVLTALMWMNPAAWIAGRFLDRDRERACDEWVAAGTRQPRAYAQSLARILDLRLGHTNMPAPGLAARRGDLFHRIRDLLDGRVLSARLSAERLAAALALAALVAVIAIAWAPRVQMGALTASAQEAPPSSPLPPPPPEAPAPVTPGSEPAPPPDLPQTPMPAVPETAPHEAAAPAAELPLAPRTTPRQLEPGAQPIAIPNRLSERSWIALLETASGINGDGDKARVLARAATRMPTSTDVIQAYLDATKSIRSADELARVLTAVASRSLSANALADVVAASERIRSDSRRADVLIHIVHNAAEANQVGDLILRAASDLSRSERERVVRAQKP